MEKICPNCGNKYKDMNFCTKCGTKLIDNTNSKDNNVIPFPDENNSELLFNPENSNNSEDTNFNENTSVFKNENLNPTILNSSNANIDFLNEEPVSQNNNINDNNIDTNNYNNNDNNNGNNNIQYDNNYSQLENQKINSNPIDIQNNNINKKKNNGLKIGLIIGISSVCVISIIVVGLFLIFGKFFLVNFDKLSIDNIMEMEISTENGYNNPSSDKNNKNYDKSILKNYQAIHVEMNDNYKPSFDIRYVEVFDVGSFYNNPNINDIVSILNKRSKALAVQGYAEAEEGYIKYYSSDDFYGSSEYIDIFNSGKFCVKDIDGNIVLENDDIVSVTTEKSPKSSDYLDIYVNLTEDAAVDFAKYSEENPKKLLEASAGGTIFASDVIENPIYNGRLCFSRANKKEDAEVFAAIVNSGYYEGIATVDFIDYADNGDGNEDNGNDGLFEDESTGHKYEFIIKDVSWSEAYVDCLDRGGYLINFETQSEIDLITKQLELENKQDIKFWIGATREANSEEYRWINDKEIDYEYEPINKDEYYSEYWLEGEPNFFYDNTEEDCLDMFYHKPSSRWVWNDVPNEILKTVPSYKGTIGYICEYDD